VKKYNYILCAISVVCCINIAEAKISFEWTPEQRQRAKDTVIQKGTESVYNPAIQAKAIGYILYSDKKFAARYVQHAQFYAKKKERDWVNDNLIDHLAYPIVDHAVGNAMAIINKAEAVNAITDNISHKEREFIADNVQLIVTAGLITVGRNMLGEKGATLDGEKFGKACVAQVTCDAADKYIVQPLVKSYIGNDNSWKAMLLSSVSNYVLSSIIIGEVDKI